MTLQPLFLLAASMAYPSTADLELPWVFADHMVLQQGAPIRVFGEGAPGAQVRVSFAAETRVTQASSAGHWEVELRAQPASGQGRLLVIESGDDTRHLEDVVVGEVWVCAGQSNMDFPLRRATRSAAGADVDPAACQKRLCDRNGTTPPSATAYEDAELQAIAEGRYYRGSWALASPETAADFSAVGFFFGRALEDALDVPIGLIDVSVGGSSTEGWISKERLGREPGLAPLVEDFLGADLTHPFIRQRATQHLERWFRSDRSKARPRHFFEPGFLHDQAIATLAPFSIRGALWYQGESNAHLPDLAGRLLELLVADWRSAWGRDDLPIYYVQLPALNRDTWPSFREMQRAHSDGPHLGMAVAIDVGHPTDVHPPDKSAVGQRLAALALARTYGKSRPCDGPALARSRTEGGELILSFRHAGGLTWAAGRGPTGFEVAGNSRRHYPAAAEIRGQEIVLSSPEVDHPSSARYAWAPDPQWSLVNGAGLPASPFRLQEWEPTRVACIGDSITAGLGLADPDSESYPAVLQTLLGDAFDVRNHGLSGTGVVQSTMRGDWRRAFRFHKEHRDALRFRPDVVVSNLGINDIMSWEESGESFDQDYAALLGDYAASEPHPDAFLWTPLAPLFPGHAFHGSAAEGQIHRAIRRVADAEGAAAVDVSKAATAHSDWFPDHIHPDARGAAAIAGAVFEALRGAELEHVTAPRLRLYVMVDEGPEVGTALPGSNAVANSRHPADGLVRRFRAGPQPGGSNGPWTQLIPRDTAPRRLGPEVAFGRMLHAAGERDFAVVRVQGIRSETKGDGAFALHVEQAVTAAAEALPDSVEVEIAALLCATTDARARRVAERLRAGTWASRRLTILMGHEAPTENGTAPSRSTSSPTGDRRHARFSVHDLEIGHRGWQGLPPDASMELGRRFARAWLSLGGARSWRGSHR